jgi:hypothetical protein
MYRVETLSERLRDQLEKKASIEELLVTVQMLQAELLHLQSTESENRKSKVAIDIPSVFEEISTQNNSSEEKELHVLQIDEADIDAELEQIRKAAEAINNVSLKNRPSAFFDPIEDTPTLSQQKPTPTVSNSKKELHETIAQKDQTSLNDKLKEDKKELSDTLKDIPVKDLKKAIGINDRFLFINELFSGDEIMYERSIKTINSFSIYAEAEYWIRRELKTKLGWDEQSSTVKQFDQIVKRRFSFI